MKIINTEVKLGSNPIHWLAFGFGSGLAAKAPGTFGTLAALIPLLYLQTLSWPVYLLIVILGFIVGIFICGRTSAYLRVHDHSGIVWDEFVGMWITMLWVPVGWFNVLLGFVLFRLFDIFKPWPIKWLDRKVHGGIGIMLDDVLAAVFACLCLHGILWGIGNQGVLNV